MPTSVKALASILRSSSPNILVITGAGVSTSSGIPDYRSPGRPLYKPLQHSDFIAKESVRRRYWARSFVGYSLMAGAMPNAGHLSLAQLERLGFLNTGLITQNVDRLHQRAGHRDVLELHGTVMECECMKCKATCSRHTVQEKMTRENSAWQGLLPSSSRSKAASSETLGMLPPEPASSSSSTQQQNTNNTNETLSRHSSRPDGDVELDALDLYDPFIVPTCFNCGEAMLKPRVVFHGGNVDAAVAANAKKRTEECSGVLVVGSTLSTFSAFRLVRDISLRKLPVAIINNGNTRGDEHCTLKISEDINSVLSQLVKELSGNSIDQQMQTTKTTLNYPQVLMKQR
jgi:NAD+-dependent protein deacetylase sirtuin 4